MEYVLCIYYNSRINYYPLQSAWAANLIAINMMRADARIEEIQLVNKETGEIEKCYVR
jgi:hypothetical protein